MSDSDANSLIGSEHASEGGRGDAGDTGDEGRDSGDGGHSGVDSGDDIPLQLQEKEPDKQKGKVKWWRISYSIKW